MDYDRISILQKQLDIVNQWLILKQKNIRLMDYLKEKKYYRIAVYGMGIYGRHIFREFKDSDIEVVFGIDANLEGEYLGIKIYNLNKIPQTVDAVVNTIFYDPNVIKDIESVLECPIISLEELIFESYK